MIDSMKLISKKRRCLRGGHCVQERGETTEGADGRKTRENRRKIFPKESPVT